MPTIEVSDKAMEYLKRHAEPLVDTSISVLDRILTEHAELKGSLPSNDNILEMRFAGGNLPSVKFTTITSAKVAGKNVTQRSWNHILEDLITACMNADADAGDVRSLLQANTADGPQSDNGYRYVPSAGFSFQGLEANRVCRNLAILSERFGIALEIDVRWQDEEKAAFPKQSARIVLP